VDEYHKIATTLRTSFMYTSATTGLPVTGLTQASFTIEIAKDGTGGQATTGVTIAEVSAVNNAGEYSVTVSGTTGFVSATGTYDLVIYRTSDPERRWSTTIRVTSDGTGAGSWGDAAFTATASDGRVVVGGVALADVVIKILHPSGVLYVQTTSNASGVYGPIYFSVAGTYTISAQKSGYTTASGTITVLGSTATGPGADLSLVLSSTSNTLLASNLWAYARRQMKDRTGSKADLEIQQSVDDAIEMLSLAKTWPKYHEFSQITTNAPYATGTIAIVSGSTTVTLTSGTWPTWAALGELYIDGQWYPVDSRSSASVVLLKTAWGTASITGSTYNLVQHGYALPTDLQRLDKLLWDRGWASSSVPVSMATLQMNKACSQFGNPRALEYAIADDKIHFWPWPSESRTVNVLYFRRPAKLASASDIADWDAMNEVVLRRAIDYQVSLRTECVAGTTDQCRAHYDAALADAFAADKTPVNRDFGTSTRDSSRPFLRPTIT
jgi:hypothetical protein